MHKFAPPPTLVEEEFNNVWNAIENDLKQQGRTFADEGTTEEKAREEYRGIAERRVRLGLVLAEIGEKNNIKVTDDELSRAIVERARQIPGREQEVWDYYRKNPQALAERARADLRGEGGRLPGRARQGDRQAGHRARSSTRKTRTTRPAAALIARRRGMRRRANRAIESGRSTDAARRLAARAALLVLRQSAADMSGVLWQARPRYICDECVSQCVAVLEQHGGVAPIAPDRRLETGRLIRCAIRSTPT